MVKKVCIGIDLGGTEIKYGIVDIEGNVYWNSKKPTKALSSSKEVLQNIVDAGFEALNFAKEHSLEVLAVGLGTPGLVENCNTVVGEATNITGWKNISLGSEISNKLNLPTFIGNDAEMMGLGEFNASKEESDDTIIYITLGTGIGGAIFINGKLFQGHFGAGGELGVIPMIINNEVKNWEDIASTAAMVRLYKKESKLNESEFSINGKIIIKKFFEGEKLAIDVVETTTNYIAMGIAGYINIFNPKKIVIGGGVSQAGDFFINKIKQHIPKYVLSECYAKVEVEVAKLGNKAGFIGAGVFALKKSISIVEKYDYYKSLKRIDETDK